MQKSSNDAIGARLLTKISPIPPLGFHYYPDARHYTALDGSAWIPLLARLQSRWLVVESSLNAAIPEAFLQNLLNHNIEPIVVFPIACDQDFSSSALQFLIDVYARWGIRYIQVFHTPNQRSSWSASGWGQVDIVERFADRFIPFANAIRKADLTPVLPPLVPGGDYWDTVFLRRFLLSLRRRGEIDLLENLVLGAATWTFDHPLDWGKGGPQCWPNAAPYADPQNPDQRGFHTGGWYASLYQNIVGKPARLFLFQAGAVQNPQKDAGAVNPDQLPLLLEETGSVASIGGHTKQPVPAAEILGTLLWRLTSGGSQENDPQSFFTSPAEPNPLGRALLVWLEHQSAMPSSQKTIAGVDAAPNRFPIDHYVLLPDGNWFIPPEFEFPVRQFVQKFKATLGYSLAEARLAHRITIFRALSDLSEDQITELRAGGSIVDVIDGDGTTIATCIAER